MSWGDTMWSEEFRLALQWWCSCQWCVSSISASVGAGRIHCPPVVADRHNRIQLSATGYKPPFPMSRSDSSRCCFTARGDWAILTTTFHDMLAQPQPDCGGLLNVKALCLPLCLYFWLNHQITSVSPFPRLLFLLRQAGMLPGLSLL